MARVFYYSICPDVFMVYFRTALYWRKQRPLLSRTKRNQKICGSSFCGGVTGKLFGGFIRNHFLSAIVFLNILFAVITCNLILFLVWFVYGMVKKKPWDLFSAVFGNVPFGVAILTGYFAAAGHSAPDAYLYRCVFFPCFSFLCLRTL